MAAQLPPENPIPAAVPVPHTEEEHKRTHLPEQGAVTTIDAEGPIVSRRELWAYYLYYNGDNGVGPLGYAQTLFQTLANGAGKDPTTGGPCGSAGGSAQCVLPWNGGTLSVSSVVLIANGLSFMVSATL
jgi:hypothetical protein